MAYLFLLLALLSLLLFLLGLIKPSLVVRWGGRRSRRDLTGYVVALFVFCFLIVLTVKSGLDLDIFNGLKLDTP